MEIVALVSMSNDCSLILLDTWLSASGANSTSDRPVECHCEILTRIKLLEMSDVRYGLRSTEYVTSKV